MKTHVAEDQGMLAILEVVQQVAPTSIPVLIRGARGTGKELVARAIHENSCDPSLPFLAVHLASLPDALLEAELLGYLKGAFPGADRSREGIFVQARGGTVFLDEIALLPPAFQAKLLRILQEHTIVPLGSATERPVAFRLVTATSRSLRECIAKGEFREDLYYRLQAVTIDMPPLRKQALDAVPRAHPLSPGPRGSPGSEDSARFSYEDGKRKALEDYRRRTVERALRATHGNISQAAETCGLTRAAFQRILRALDLDRRRFKT